MIRPSKKPFKPSYPKFTIKRQPKRRRHAMAELAERERKAIERAPCLPNAIPKIERAWDVTYSDGRNMVIVRDKLRTAFSRNEFGYQDGRQNSWGRVVITHVTRVWMMNVVLYERAKEFVSPTARRPTRSPRHIATIKPFVHESLQVMQGMREGIEWHYAKATMTGVLDNLRRQ